jgi:glycosyltransferase involved in cell wall biosynthesis
LIIDHCPKNIFSREFFYDRYIYRGIRRMYVVHTSKKEFALTKKPKQMVRIYNQNIANIGVSKYIEQEILENAGVQNAVNIYNAVDNKWKNETDDIPIEIRDLKYILSYGRIDDSIKDFRFLIDSYMDSGLCNKNVYLMIMGNGKDLESLKGYVTNLECRDYIKFLPFTTNPFPYISRARCVSLTSKYEGFPMVLIESLSLGTPVVSLDIVSGPSEIVKHKENGLLVSKRSIPLFAEALNTMCLDEALYLHCKENAEASVLRFSKEEISIKWDQLLQNELR